jgi:oligoendopeptidase F
MTYKLSPWLLADLYPALDASELEAAFDQVEEQIASFEGVRAKLNPGIGAEPFLEIVRVSERITRIVYQLSGFANLSFAAATQDQSAQALVGRINQFAAEVQNRSLFFSLWWKDLDDANALRLMQASGDYRYYLEVMRKFKPHTLSEAEEKIVNLKNVTGASAFSILYDSITSRYVFKLEVDGQVKEMTLEELYSYRYSPDPEMRARSYQEGFRVFGADGPILGQIYQTLVRDWHNENLSLRKFATPISARNLANDIPNQVVDTLLDVARKNTGVFQRYFRLKAHMLGVEKLRRYDLPAPVVKSEKKFEFDRAVTMVFEALTAFDPKLAEMANRVLDQDHLDSEIRKGKVGGAFCASILPEMTPYVLLSYDSRPRDVATLAHELGHAIHSMLAAGHSLFTFQSSLPLAETASTFSEMLLTDKMLREESDESVRRDLLFKQVGDAYGVIMRQAFFAIFEKQAHEMVQKNASVDDLSQAYFENLKEQFGDSVELSEDFRWEWVSIPHIFQVPFYVYAYSFGQLLVFALYQQYRAEGDAFKPRLIKILSAGGAEAPEKILAEAGINIRSEAFWQGGFDVLSKLVDELEKMK